MDAQNYHLPLNLPKMGAFQSEFLYLRKIFSERLKFGEASASTWHDTTDVVYLFSYHDLQVELKCLQSVVPDSS